MRGDGASPRSASWTSKWLHGTLYMTIRSSAVGTYSPGGMEASETIAMQGTTRSPGPGRGTSAELRDVGAVQALRVRHGRRRPRRELPHVRRGVPWRSHVA